MHFWQAQHMGTLEVGFIEEADLIDAISEHVVDADVILHVLRTHLGEWMRLGNFRYRLFADLPNDASFPAHWLAELPIGETNVP